MFSFNFPDPSNSSEHNDIKVKEKTKDDIEKDITEDCREILEESVLLEHSDAVKTYQISDSICVKCLDRQSVENKVSMTANSEHGIQQAVSQHLDLVPNVYEGGLTVWECSLDLAQYLHGCDVCFDNKKVLELGCGAGLPGIVAMLKGATHIHFQDYNPEVLEYLTVPNVRMNRSVQCTCTCRYFSGDWNKFRSTMLDDTVKYDVILTAETIYKPANYRKLSMIFQQFLTIDGIVYVAAKSNYFGVGGGTRDFEQFILKDGVFTVEVCHTIEAGVPREILKLQFKR